MHLVHGLDVHLVLGAPLQTRKQRAVFVLPDFNLAAVVVSVVRLGLSRHPLVISGAVNARGINFQLEVQLLVIHAPQIRIQHQDLLPALVTPDIHPTDPADVNRVRPVNLKPLLEIMAVVPAPPALFLVSAPPHAHHAHPVILAVLVADHVRLVPLAHSLLVGVHRHAVPAPPVLTVDGLQPDVARVGVILFQDGERVLVLPVQ